MLASVRSVALKLYKEARKPYWGTSIDTGSRYFGRLEASRAWGAARRNAKIITLWDSLESAGLVRIEMVPDDTAGDLEWHTGEIGSDIVNHRAWNAHVDRVKRQLEQDGAWGIVGQYRVSDCSAWVDSDSLWGFLYADAGDTLNQLDVMAETIEALREALRHRCPLCRQSRPGHK